MSAPAPTQTDLWDRLYAVSNGHVPTPDELAARMSALRTLEPVMGQVVAVRFMVEVLTAIADRGNPDARLAADALTVLGVGR